jgi:hypothetical protein
MGPLAPLDARRKQSGDASFWPGLNSFRVARCALTVLTQQLDRPRLPPVVVVGARAFDCRAQSGQRATKLNLFPLRQCSRKLGLKGRYWPGADLRRPVTSWRKVKLQIHLVTPYDEAHETGKITLH